MTKKARWPQSAGLRRAGCLFFVNSLGMTKKSREAIGGARSIDMMVTSAETAAVLDLIGRLEHAVFA